VARARRSCKGPCRERYWALGSLFDGSQAVGQPRPPAEVRIRQSDEAFVKDRGVRQRAETMILQPEAQSSPKLARNRSQAKAEHPPGRIAPMRDSRQLRFPVAANQVGHARPPRWCCPTCVGEHVRRIIGSCGSLPAARRCQFRNSRQFCTSAAFAIRMILNSLQEFELHVPHQLLAVDRGCHGGDRVG